MTVNGRIIKTKLTREEIERLASTLDMKLVDMQPRQDGFRIKVITLTNQHRKTSKDWVKYGKYFRDGDFKKRLLKWDGRNLCVHGWTHLFEKLLIEDENLLIETSHNRYVTFDEWSSQTSQNLASSISRALDLFSEYEGVVIDVRPRCGCVPTPRGDSQSIPINHYNMVSSNFAG